MTPFWTDDHLTLYGGDCRQVLAELPAESVHCVVTSPPYWGLRDYGTASWDSGDEACDHQRPFSEATLASSGLNLAKDRNAAQSNVGSKHGNGAYTHTCGKCGAVRIDSQLGLEPTPEAYVENMVAVFREVRRVLRADGTLWLNLGDSYAGSGKGAWGNDEAREANRHRVKEVYVPTRSESPLAGKTPDGLKPKDLVGIPWRVAFALQADGWYLRSDIIWSKPNPMPESVTDRPTKAHEYLFLLTKSPRYYFDGEAVRRPISPNWKPGAGAPMPELGDHRREDGARGHQAQRTYDEAKGANIRTVWEIATEPYPGAHFATFPRKLVEPCVKAGTSERGVCPECGAPWVRVVERGESHYTELGKANGADFGRNDSQPGNMGNTRTANGTVPSLRAASSTTTGWRRTCSHGNLVGEPLDEADPTPVPAVVLDPFAGSGTTLFVAQTLGRRGVGIDLNPEYLKQALARNAQTPLGLVG